MLVHAIAEAMLVFQQQAQNIALVERQVAQAPHAFTAEVQAQVRGARWAVAERAASCGRLLMLMPAANDRTMADAGPAVV